MENLGWIKLHRRIREWEWYQDSQMVHLFIHLILSANRKPDKWKGIEVARGQLITGRKQLSKETGITEQTIRTCLIRLKSTSELTIKSTNKFSIITICNYDKYQPENIESNQQNNQPIPNKQPTTNHKQEVKEVKNINTVQFDIFWNKYHTITGKSKTDKVATSKHWKKLSTEEKAKAIENIEPFYNSLPDKNYCKIARTYLSGKAFNDQFINAEQSQHPSQKTMIIEYEPND